MFHAPRRKEPQPQPAPAMVVGDQLVMKRGAVSVRVALDADVFGQALAFAERWDHSTPGAYAASAQAAALRALAERGAA